MNFGRMGARGGMGSLGLLGSGLNPASYAPYPAPAGYHWAFVTNDFTGQNVINDITNQPSVSLVGN